MTLKKGFYNSSVQNGGHTCKYCNVGFPLLCRLKTGAPHKGFTIKHLNCPRNGINILNRKPFSDTRSSGRYIDPTFLKFGQNSSPKTLVLEAPKSDLEENALFRPPLK